MAGLEGDATTDFAKKREVRRRLCSVGTDTHRCWLNCSISLSAVELIGIALGCFFVFVFLFVCFLFVCLFMVRILNRELKAKNGCMSEKGEKNGNSCLARNLYDEQ